MRLLLIAALTLLPSSVCAQTLWRNIDAGMFYSRVLELQPGGQGNARARSLRYEEAERFGTCTADVVVTFDDRRVSRVDVYSQHWGALGLMMAMEECGADARTALSRRHGRPQSSSTGSDSYGEFSRDVWTRDALEIEFKLYGSDSAAQWSISYRPVARP
jgi:hypothetical protein